MDDGEKNNAQRSLIKCDQYKISQVLFNLLDNAMKFTEKGKVAVSVRKLDEKNDFQVVRIADTGRGIDPLIKGRLFQKFATKSEKGTGLGLYLSRKIIEAHGGRIWVENTNNSVNGQGIGAIFNFSLPS
jgi:signal transduction histidine kinase